MRNPLFIVGSPRSGTSALVDLSLAAGYRGFREGMFLTLLTPISTAIDRHFDTFASPDNREILISAIDRQMLKTRVLGIFKDLADTHNPAPPWFDKPGNPEMIEAIPLLRSLWPEAVFVFARRRGIENIFSRIRKFPMHNFEYHCRDWARNMAIWRATRDTIPTSHRREVDQQDMIQFPERVVDEMLSFLEIHPERREEMVRTLRTNRPQQTQDGSAARIHSLASTGWNEEQLSTFKRFCGPEMEAYGYSMGDAYWAGEG